MSDENFINRWARRKQEVAKAEEKKPTPDAEKKGDSAKPGSEGHAQPVVDLTKLPSLDQITAETDITTFLKPGVPADLARAALRRAWATDPAVRDFVGLQENDWVFNKPGPDQGFGPLGPEHDVEKMLSQIFSDAQEPEKPPITEPATTQIAKSEPIAEEVEVPPVDPAPPVVTPDEPDAATHNEDADRLRRSHGGALPTPISKT